MIAGALTHRRVPSDKARLHLIELLVVIAIIVVLSASYSTFQGIQNQAKKTQAKNDLTQIVTAVNAYYTGRKVSSNSYHSAEPPPARLQRQTSCSSTFFVT